MSRMASSALASKPTFSHSKSPTTQMIHISLSTVTVPYFFRSSRISLRMLGVIDRYGNSYLRCTDHIDGSLVALEDFEYLAEETVCQQHAARFNLNGSNITPLAATALILPFSVSLEINVPGACGSIVFSRRTGMLAYLAGWIQVGCRILAPK